MSQDRPPYRYFGTFRLVLAALVVLNHGYLLDYGASFANWTQQVRIGYASVLAFFVLSGFIMAESASRFYPGRPGPFTINRFLKIFPPFWGALAVSIAVHAWLSGQGLLSTALEFERADPEAPFGVWNMLWNMMSATPASLYGNVFAVPGGEYVFVRYIWAVTVEVTFYVLVALYIGCMTGRSLNQRWLAIGLGVFLSVYMLGMWRGTLETAISYAPMFLVGIALYNRRKGGIWPWALLASLALCLPRVLQLFTGKNVLSDTVEISPYVWVGVAIFYAMVACIWLLADLRKFIIPAKLDRSLGDISYALYLNHFAVLLLCFAYRPEGTTGTWLYAMALVISLGIASAMYLLIERPIRAYKDKVRGSSISAA